MNARIVTFLVFLAVSLVAHADQAPKQQIAADFMASLKPQRGEVTLPNSIARLNLADGFAYLDAADSKRLIEDAWGNPPGSAKEVLGMIIPPTGSPLPNNGYGVVITYQEDGHVSDDDADKIDYGALLKDMQKGTESANEDRKKQGYEAMTLVGWAEPPHYDKAAHKLYWAKDLEVGGHHGLNYSIRVLGRKGVLEMNAVASMEQLASVKEAMKNVVSFAEFNDGSRYTDFNVSTDKVAAYGLAALVAGGIAAKTGLFAKLLLALVALKKFAILIFAAIAGFFGKLFKKKPQSGPFVN